jgi:hypothetical protein
MEKNQTEAFDEHVGKRQTARSHEPIQEMRLAKRSASFEFEIIAQTT